MESHVLDWVIADRLGACANPTVAETAAAALRRVGVGLLINLYERPDSADFLKSMGAEGLHLPVKNSDPPSQEQLDAGVAAIRHALDRNLRVVVHCGAGLGRTGTLLAAYLVSQGADAETAIATVREVRPGSVETLQQEDAVREFAKRRAGGPTRQTGSAAHAQDGPD